ncbi:hypothetical protein MBLNU230_g2824t1 [Neophaeotheca triangularis]
MLLTRFGGLSRPYAVLLPAVVFCLIVSYLALGGKSHFKKVDDWLASSTEVENVPVDNADDGDDDPANNKFYTWTSQSNFAPVNRANVSDASIEELCASFPHHLLNDIQPVLKTGHGVLDARVRPQLQSLSACLSNLLIFSDLTEEFEGHQVIDVINEIPPKLSHHTDQLENYFLMQELASNGSLATFDQKELHPWALDKFKFLPGVSKAWQMRPEKRWYIFYEADTYIVWDNLFRLLEHFDADKPLYFGSPSPGRKWFANGGPGFVISRGAMRKLIQEDWDKETGEYLGSRLTEYLWADDLLGNCCGDSTLGWALFRVGVEVSGMWPMFQPHPAHGVPFSDLYWCQPLITMHKPHVEDMVGLWRWEEARRDPNRPLLFRDLADYLNITSVAFREDWDNAAWDGYPAPSGGPDGIDPHSSLEACSRSCDESGNCFQWTYHLKRCTFVRSFRLGTQKEPRGEKPKTHKDEEGNVVEEPVKEWSLEDQRYMAGWDVDNIKRWIEKRPCEEVEWVKPSIERIF